MRSKAARIVCGLLCALGCLAAGATEEVEGEVVPAPREGGDSLTSSMQGESGLSIQTLCTNCNNADLSLGGLGNEHVSVVCDGMPVASGLAQIYLLSVMPGTVIDKVAVKKGPGQVDLQGGSIGGAVELERRRLEPGLHLRAAADAGSFGWSSTKMDLYGGSDRIRGSLTGTWATSDAIDPDGDGYTNLPSFDRVTLEGRGEIDLGRDQRLTLGLIDYDESQEDGIGAVDFGFNPMTFEFGFIGYNLENVELERRQYDAGYEAGFLGGGRLKVSAAYATRSQDVEQTPRALLPDTFDELYFIDEEQQTGTLGWSQPFGPRLTLAFGLSGSEIAYEVVDITFNDLNSTPDFVFEESLLERGGWIDATATLGANLTLTAGVRYVDFSYDDNEFRDEWMDYVLPEGDRLVPRAELSWKPREELQLRFSAGQGYRTPAPAFDEVCCGRQYRGNRGVEIESSTALGVEATYQPDPDVRFSGSVFATEFDDYILRMATLSYQYTNTYQNVNIPEARTLSLDLQGSYRINEWVAVKGSFSRLDADNRTEDDAIVALLDFYGTPVSKTFTSSTIPYTVETRATAGVDLVRPWWGITGGVQAQYQGPMEIQWFDDLNPDPDPELGGSILQPDLIETDSFWIVNLRAQKELKWGLSVYAGVDNIGDEVQSDLADYHYEYNWGALRGRYYYGGVTYRLPERR